MFCIADRIHEFEPQNNFCRFYVYSLGLSKDNNDLSVLVEQDEESSVDLTQIETEQHHKYIVEFRPENTENTGQIEPPKDDRYALCIF